MSDETKAAPASTTAKSSESHAKFEGGEMSDEKAPEAETKPEPRTDPWRTVASVLRGMFDERAPKRAGWTGLILEQEDASDHVWRQRDILCKRLGRDLLVCIDPAFSEEEQKRTLDMILTLARDVAKVLERARDTARSYEEGWLAEARKAGVSDEALSFEQKLFNARKRFDTDPTFRRKLLDTECELGESAP